MPWDSGLHDVPVSLARPQELSLWFLYQFRLHESVARYP